MKREPVLLVLAGVALTLFIISGFAYLDREVLHWNVQDARATTDELTRLQDELRSAQQALEIQHRGLAGIETQHRALADGQILTSLQLDDYLSAHGDRLDDIEACLSDLYVYVEVYVYEIGFGEGYGEGEGQAEC